MQELLLNQEYSTDSHKYIQIFWGKIQALQGNICFLRQHRLTKLSRLDELWSSPVFARVLAAHPCATITEGRIKCCTLPAPCCPLMDHTYIRDMDDLSEAAFTHLVLVLQGSWVVFIWCFLTSIWFKMQGESAGFLLTLAMNSGEEAGAAATSHWSRCKKQASANGNTSDNVYSPYWIEMDMSICCHSSWRNVFLLKNLGKKNPQFYRHLLFTSRANSSGWTLSHL